MKYRSKTLIVSTVLMLLCALVACAFLPFIVKDNAQTPSATTVDKQVGVLCSFDQSDTPVTINFYNAAGEIAQSVTPAKNTLTHVTFSIDTITMYTVKIMCATFLDTLSNLAYTGKTAFDITSKVYSIILDPTASSNSDGDVLKITLGKATLMGDDYKDSSWFTSFTA